MKGLSPRVRGNQRQATGTAGHQRSIPARAGEPRNLEGIQVEAEVYPRACGGTTGIRARPCTAEGLSPRVRGNLVPCHRDATGPGSIPARAGEPATLSPNDDGRWVYPRACGGTRPRTGPPGSRRGSIPARAGEPGYSNISRGVNSVYPRACGGTRYGVSMALPPPRSIPARAGEPTAPPFVAVSAQGLSPRVRGNLDVPGHRRLRFRSIPARAGEPQGPEALRAQPWVYPRACGGTIRFLGCISRTGGLSPRVRGNLEGWVLLLNLQGSIPARAGEPLKFTFEV